MKKTHGFFLRKARRVDCRPGDDVLVDAYALVLVALKRDHHVRLIQHKHGDLLDVEKPELDAPVQHFARSADHYVFVYVGPSHHCGRHRRLNKVGDTGG